MLLLYSIGILGILIFIITLTSYRKKTSSSNHKPHHTMGVYPENTGLYLGIPSPVSADTTMYNNYLITHTTYALSYNRTKSNPNWVAWHLSSADLGSQSRSNQFQKDPYIPKSWPIVDGNSIRGSASGFDRGHNCPSGDRTANTAMNIETFYMTNIIPQAPKNNELSWDALERAVRNQVITNHYEAYIYNGSFGIGGVGAKSPSSKNKIQNWSHPTTTDSIWVPKYIFKIALLLPEGDNDLERIEGVDSNHMHIIAVLMPNIQTVNNNWQQYVTTIQAIEDSMIQYNHTEVNDNNHSNANPLNPIMSFYNQITNKSILQKIKNMKWHNSQKRRSHAKKY